VIILNILLFMLLIVIVLISVCVLWIILKLAILGTDNTNHCNYVPTACYYIYRVSQEECAILWESVPYFKLYQYNPKHLYSKLHGYGDNGQRKVWSSCGSTYCMWSVDLVSWCALSLGVHASVGRSHQPALVPYEWLGWIYTFVLWMCI
jgi:hypothetical protein